MSAGATWAIVLAAGEGSRLRSLTTTASGIAVPKQFCSLQEGESLLQETLARAESVAPRQRIVSVVAQQHRRWWEGPLWSLAPRNVIVQPENKGTAPGLLLPLLHIAQQDANAVVLVLPSDHHVRQERLLQHSLRRAVRNAAADPAHVFLLGVTPEEVDPELGYIVPHSCNEFRAAPVSRFVEKPSPDLAGALIEKGALWNVFILAASVQAVLALYRNRYPSLVERMAAAVARDAGEPRGAAAAHGLYPELPTLDFSRDVLEGNESHLRVLAVPACGWSDLGTPRRVAETLQRVASEPHNVHPGAGRTAFLSLAAQQGRLQRLTAAFAAAALMTLSPLHPTRAADVAADAAPATAGTARIGARASSGAALIVSRPTLTLEGAKSVAEFALAYAREHRAPGAAVAVVDAAGIVVYLERLDGTFQNASNISIGKARTAVLFGKPTRAFEDLVNKGRYAMLAVPEVAPFTPLMGGVPIDVEGHFVGAIGVSGAASAVQDDEIASAGAAEFVKAQGSQAAAVATGTAAIRSTAAARPNPSAVTVVPRVQVDAGFAKDTTLVTDADSRVNASRRDGPGEAEIHLADTDVFYVLSGSADLVVGGTVSGEHHVSESEIRGSRIEGGDVKAIARGDVVTIPRGTPHWFRRVTTPFTYYVVKSTHNG